ncbi:MAG: helix-turn-helix transcriptional regulator [Oscillospiraceae bacterium]|nr:helix-turn-helix transcriptional regulator [Oscillospiraceae bacterium]
MIGERLSEIRKDHRHTQVDLAQRLGVSLSTVRSWEQNKSSPSHEMLICICRLYQVSSDYLLGLSDTDPAYAQRRAVHLLSEQEIQELQNYEKYLIWKHRSRE